MPRRDRPGTPTGDVTRALSGLGREGVVAIVVDRQNDFCSPARALARTGIPTGMLAA